MTDSVSLPSRAARTKAASAPALIGDVDYFAREIIRRSEQLHRLRANDGWNQTAILARRIRNQAQGALVQKRQAA